MCGYDKFHLQDENICVDVAFVFFYQVYGILVFGKRYVNGITYLYICRLGSETF